MSHDPEDPFDEAADLEKLRALEGEAATAFARRLLVTYMPFTQELAASMLAALCDDPETRGPLEEHYNETWGCPLEEPDDLPEQQDDGAERPF